MLGIYTCQMLLKGGNIRVDTRYGTTVRGIKGDTRSSDYGSDIQAKRKTPLIPLFCCVVRKQKPLFSQCWVQPCLLLAYRHQQSTPLNWDSLCWSQD